MENDNKVRGLKSSYSLFNLDIKLDKVVDISLIKEMIQCVLDHRFNLGSKRQIESFPDRFNFACPYCGDSTKDVFKKRGNLYFKNMSYKCFNCGEFGTLYNFLNSYKDYCNFDDNDLFILKGYKGEVNYHKPIKLDFFDNDKIEKFTFKKETLMDSFGWLEIKDMSKASFYLKGRHQENGDHFLYNPKYNSLIILNCDSNNNVLGFQTRSIGKKKSFYSYGLSKIYKELDKKFPDEAKNLDSISYIFNILTVDYSQDITIFEGPFDSFLYYNSLALTGASKKLPFEIEHIRYWYDNDKTGITKAIEELKNGNYIFLWKKYLRDSNIIEPIKDLNDLIIYSRKKQIKLLPFTNYFSNNKIDMFYI